jgi:hypothetical protein
MGPLPFSIASIVADPRHSPEGWGQVTGIAGPGDLLPEVGLPVGPGLTRQVPAVRSGFTRAGLRFSCDGSWAPSSSKPQAEANRPGEERGTAAQEPAECGKAASFPATGAQPDGGALEGFLGRKR